MGVASVSAELDGLDLGDRRLNERARSALLAISQRPTMGFPRIFRERAALQGLYRLMNNARVERDALLEPHSTASWRRASEHAASTLVCHDTTMLTYAGEEPREGLQDRGNKHSFHAHFALSVAEGAAPVVHGVVGFHAYSVLDGVWHAADEGQTLEPLLSGQERWRLMVEHVHRHAPDDLHLIHVMDREADDYELFTVITELGADFVIRATHDRRLSVPEQRLRTALSDAPFRLARTVQLSRRSKSRPPKSRKTHTERPDRDAVLLVRAGRVEIVRPDGVAPLGEPVMEVSVVEVVELDPPDGQQAVHWLLLSSLPVETVEQIIRIVDIYGKRWLSEEFHRALKTGCAAEKRQGRSLWSLQNTIALLVPIAWRLLALRALERHDSRLSASVLFDEVELMALRQRVPKARLPARPTCRQVLLAIASAGGHLKHNGEPGWQTLGRGMEDLMLFVAGFRAALQILGQHGASET